MLPWLAILAKELKSSKQEVDILDEKEDIIS